MKRILFAWVGNTDLKVAKGDEKDGLGPIGQAVQNQFYEQVCIISNYTKAETKDYCEWLKTLTSSKIIIEYVHLSYPTDFEGIYTNVVRILTEARSHWKENEFSFTYHLSPGTPAMASIWVLLAKTTFKAELIESSKTHGVKRVDIPFDISLEYLGDQISPIDNELARIVQGLPPETPEFNDIVHKCRDMKRAIGLARRLAQHDVPILIQGESGTGKELFARAIHSSSLRRKGPFMAFNCGAIPEALLESELFGHVKGSFTGAIRDHKGLFEIANGGTLFLDEIGELPFSAQVKLLRVLQEREIIRIGDEKSKPVDVRIIAATNRNLIEEISKGEFREDLFHRVAVGFLELPPLRKREGDLNLLINAILKEVNEELSKVPGWKHKNISAGARNLMLGHKWYGNVRELKNTISRASIWCAGTNISKEDVESSILSIKQTGETNDSVLDHDIGNDFSLPELLGDVARYYIKKAFDETKGNKTLAAKLIGLNSYQTFSDWMKKYGVE